MFYASSFQQAPVMTGNPTQSDLMPLLMPPEVTPEVAKAPAKPVAAPVYKAFSLPQFNPFESLPSQFPQSPAAKAPSGPQVLPGGEMPAIKGVVAPGAKGPAQPPRRLYVLHSGMIDSENGAANSLRRGLMERGVADRDIVVLPTPYPRETLFGRPCPGSENFRIFRESADPTSAVSRTAYQNYQAALTRAGIRPGDEVVWVGHSAGGQMGMTLAGMARDQQGFQMSHIITLGSPIQRANAPEDVRVRNYQSPQDRTVNYEVQDSLSEIIGAPVQVYPRLDGNDRTRVFTGVGHSQWYTNPQVLDRILTETNPDYRPLWYHQINSPGRMTQLLGTVSRGLDEGLNLTFEGVPRTRPAAK